MKASIIIPTYNHAQYIIKAVESALNQRFEHDFQVIVVDDGSTDDTRNVLQPFMKKIIYHYQENQGLSSARNAGIKLAHGDYLLFLDADDIIAEDMLRIMLKAMEDNHKFIATVCKHKYFTETPDTCHEEQDLTFQIIKHGDLLHHNLMPINSVLFKSEVFAKVGLFDPKLTSLEDWDFHLRATMIGDYLVINNTLAYVRKHPNQMSANRKRMFKATVDVYQKVIKYSQEWRAQLEHLLDKSPNFDVWFLIMLKNNKSELRARLIQWIKAHPLKVKLPVFLLLSLLTYHLAIGIIFVKRQFFQVVKGI